VSEGHVRHVFGGREMAALGPEAEFREEKRMCRCWARFEATLAQKPPRCSETKPRRQKRSLRGGGGCSAQTCASAACKCTCKR
jgi:hypothetical protein